MYRSKQQLFFGIRRIFIFIACFIMLTGCQAGEDRELVIVERVVDGDTIKVQIGSKTETVRLLLVDTPESVHPTKSVQPFGKEASNYVSQLLPSGTEIELEYDGNKRDKYNRLLAYVWVQNKLLNEVLIEKGLARVAYIYEPNMRYESQLKQAQQVAQDTKVGIWSLVGYVTENGFNSETQLQETDVDSSIATQCGKPLIKGNITRSGEKLYHTPSSPQYEVTKAEEMFCSEEEAVSQGFRKVK